MSTLTNKKYTFWHLATVIALKEDRTASMRRTKELPRKIRNLSEYRLIGLILAGITMCKGAFDVKTKLLSWLLTLSLLMTMLPTAALAAAAPGTSSGTVIYVSETGDDSAVGDENAPLKTIGAAFTKAADGDTICLLSDIKLVGNLVLTGDKSVTLAGKADETAKKITYQKDTSTDLYMIEVGVENGTATATNLTLENMTIDAEAQDIRCIRVCPESQLTLENGATVCNGRAVHRSGHSGNTGTNDWGGGIVVDSNAKLIMNDGSAVTGCSAEQGGGIYLSGEMELNGGMLSGNTAVGDYFDTDHTQSAHGGAILIRANRADYDESYAVPAKLTMTGGNIQNNKAASDLSAFWRCGCYSWYTKKFCGFDQRIYYDRGVRFPAIQPDTVVRSLFMRLIAIGTAMQASRFPVMRRLPKIQAVMAVARLLCGPVKQMITPAP